MIVTKFDSAAFVICCCVIVTLKKGVAHLIKALAIYTFTLTCTIVSFTHIHPHSKTTYTILPMHDYRRYWQKCMHRCVTYIVHYIINHVTTLVLMPPTDLQIPCQCSYTICIFLLSLLIHFCTMLKVLYGFQSICKQKCKHLVRCKWYNCKYLLTFGQCHP